MALQVIGTGLGRTATYSLKLALNELGFGPCHHMEEVLHNLPTQVPLWSDAVDGQPNWEAIYHGYHSAVDWPTASFYRELLAAYPNAKFVHTYRSTESWVESFSSTIYALLARSDAFPPEMAAWLEMAHRAIAKAGVTSGLDATQLAAVYERHTASVVDTIPASQLLLFQATDGWEPLCAFLGVPVPSGPYPRSNNRVEFWERVSPPS